MKKSTIRIIAIASVIVLGWMSWYLASPLFIDEVVDEEFPIAAPGEEALAQVSEKDEAVAAEEMPEQKMAEPMPETEADTPTLIGQGQFQDGDSFHKGSGTAIIYQVPEGEHLLRFENFSATNGPDLHVLLVEHASPASRDEIMAGYLDLGALKGNIGNQNYEIPAGTDLSKYKSVVIYCMPFHVIFATASLN
jgi:Electron transfer DM13